MPRQWPVKKGDRVGVQIRDTCDRPNDPDPACPAQANLIDTACASALYHPSDRTSLIRLSEVTTVGVTLNMRVSIGECILVIILHTLTGEICIAVLFKAPLMYMFMYSSCPTHLMSGFLECF